jgi:hypothetical protein
VFEADRRPHQPGAGRQRGRAAAHRAEAEIGLAEPGFGALAALERTDDGRRQGPTELGPPDEADIAELRARAEALARAARAELAEVAVDPAALAVGEDEPRIAGQLERVGGEQAEIALGVRRGRQERGERAAPTGRADRFVATILTTFA